MRILNFYNFSRTGSDVMDIYSSNKHIGDDNAPFEFPDYDSYYVSGLGVNGEMNPYLFQYKSLHRNESSSLIYWRNIINANQGLKNYRMNMRVM